MPGNCHGQEKPKETWQLVWYPGGDPETQKGH